MNEPLLKVGILSAEEISFSLDGKFTSGENSYSGVFLAGIESNQIYIGNESAEEWFFYPAGISSFFEIHNVVIGIDFHWERKETQRFNGALQLVIENGSIRVINHISTEDYLMSVISSEMSASASLELLKAHAVISRSWLLYPVLQPENRKVTTSKVQQSNEKYIKWYERDAHVLFDVCADDHCQRYQGISKVTNRQVAEAIRQTRGNVLMYDGQLCDARYYKACGGITEEFGSCWEPVDHPYLKPVRDTADDTFFPDLTREENARKWILSMPDSFCNTRDEGVLSQVLNGFDQETADFYRWSVRYTQAGLSDVLKRKSGIDFGEILSLRPLKRGASGRITELKITGTLKTIVVGKELEIRKWLSESHLYSSAFIVDSIPARAAVPDEFILHGAGWGHGVGLCQIGAAVMGEKGYTYEQILKHYFKYATISKIY